MYDPIQSGVTTVKQHQLLEDICHIYSLGRSIHDKDENILPILYFCRTQKKNRTNL